MYKVYFLDGYEITNVEDVQFGHERDVKVHNGLGQGKFPIPDDKDLKLWTIKCTQRKTDLFELLEKLLDSKETSRLVITSDAENVSELVLLKGYDRQEPYSGVYDVTIKFIEYKEVSVRTTGVPYVSRPGKAPTPPKSVVITKQNTVYKVARDISDYEKYMKSSRGMIEQQEKYRLLDAKTNKPITNPCLLEKDKEYKITMETPISDSLSAYFKAVGENGGKIFVPSGSVNKAYAAMQKAKDEAKKRIK